MRLAELARVSAEVASTPKRTQKVALLSSLLGAATGPERALSALFLAGRFRQPKLGLGPAQLHALRVAPADSPTLDVAAVDQSFEALAGLGGRGVGVKRGEALERLFGAATLDEQRFLKRLMLGELRQGALESLVLEAVARAAGVPVDALRRAHMLAGELLPVVEAAFERGEAALLEFGLSLFRPILPMLAEPTEDVGSALQLLGTAAFERKLDGARVQLHRQGDAVRVFSRSGQDVSGALPELVEFALGLGLSECVLDGEVIGLRPDGRPLPFQETMRRFGRKLDVAKLRDSLPLTPFFFDCL
jgi:DNA ligase-1